MSSSALSSARVPLIQRRNWRTLSTKSLSAEIPEIKGQRLGGTKVAPELAELFQRLDGFVRVAARHDNDRIGWIGVFAETPPQPTLEHGREGKLRLDRIKNLRAGIDGWPRPHSCEAACDRSRGSWLRSVASSRARPGLSKPLSAAGSGPLRKPASNHRERFHSAVRSRTADAHAQFSGREFGERDGGDVRRRDAVGEEHGHAAGEQRRFAGARRRLDEQCQNRGR